PIPRMLTGGLACYRSYATADGRRLTVGALEPKFFQRLSELIDRVDLAARQYDEDQDALAGELGSIFVTRSLADWLAHFGDEDVCVGPVWTREEAAASFGSPGAPEEVPLGAHTDAWRTELGVR
ncbi:MAG TPA: CoA transferase, partial [Gaiellaceae bacterium]|nr:CoA transferase [Gaiellaceae bacterium]